MSASVAFASPVSFLGTPSPSWRNPEVLVRGTERTRHACAETSREPVFRAAGVA